MASEGGRYSTTEDPGAQLIQAEYPGISAQAILAYTMIGEAFVFESERWEARPGDFEFGKMFWELARGLLENGTVKAVRTIVDFGGKGLEGALVGLEELRQGKVRGAKLVYHM